MAAPNADLFEMTALREDSDYLFPAAQFVEYAPRSLRAQRTFARKLRERHITHHRLPANTRVDALKVLRGTAAADCTMSAARVKFTISSPNTQPAVPRAPSAIVIDFIHV